MTKHRPFTSFAATCVRRLILALACSAACLASPALAQSSAEELVRNFMSSRGIYSGYDIYAHTYPGRVIEMSGYDVLDVELPELRGSTAMATNREGWAFVAVVENHGSRPYCFRVKHAFRDRPEMDVSYLSDVNFILEPGKSQPVFTAAKQAPPGKVYAPDGDPTFYVPLLAFWPPNQNAPEGSKCKSVAPVGLQEWLDNPSARGRFPFSLR